VYAVFSRSRVDSTSSEHHHCLSSRAASALEHSRKGVNPLLSFTDWVHYLRARFNVEEGQTMAEYGVVLAVITVLIIGALTLLSDGIRAAVLRVADIVTP
jgi:Flp pilus assembly pilin Flp